MLFLHFKSHAASDFPFLKNLDMGFGMAMLCGRVIRVKKLVEKHDENGVTVHEWDDPVGASETSEGTTTDGSSVSFTSSESE
jgi:hypothetical protein